LESVVILLPAGLDVIRDVEKRLGKTVPFHEKKGDEEPSDTAVAIQEGVDRFELLMHEGALDEVRKLPVVQELLPAREALHHRIRRRRHVGCGRRCAASRSDPVLGTAELPGRGLLASHSWHQALVELADQAQREGQVPQPLQAVFESGHIVADLPHVRIFGPIQLGLVEQHI